jgi:signal transduction histidine kinase
VTLDSVSQLPGAKDLDLALVRGLPAVFYKYSYDWRDVAHILWMFLPSNQQVLKGALIALAISWVMWRHAMAPLRKATQKLAEIDADALDGRIPLSELPSEVVPFASAVNDALGRVKNGVEEQKRFIANAAHELRTPITILRAHVERPNPETFHADMERASSRIQILVEQLLATAALSGAQGAGEERIDLTEVLRQLTLDYGPLAINSGKSIVLDCAEEPVFVLGRRRGLESIFSNLIDNALRAEPEGGAIILRVAADGRVEIVDHGEGVAYEHRQQIFEPFWRKNDATAGAGLGLAIAKELLEKLHGRIWVDDTPGGGATLKRGL